LTSSPKEGDRQQRKILNLIERERERERERARKKEEDYWTLGNGQKERASLFFTYHGTMVKAQCFLDITHLR
jgi:hypothetical protein